MAALATADLIPIAARLLFVGLNPARRTKCSLARSCPSLGRPAGYSKISRYALPRWLTAVLGCKWSTPI